VDARGTPVFRCSEHATEGCPFKFQLVCVPVPDYELSDYGPVSISVPSYAVKEAEIDMELQRMASAASVPVTDKSHDVVQKGDRVELAMHTTMGGEEVKPLCSEGREYATGTLSMPDDFDAAIIGMRVGETKTFTFLGPDIALDADGKPKMDEYETTATVKRIVASKAPEIDDAWAKTVNPNVSTLAELRERVSERLAEKHEAEFQRTAIMLAGNELAKRLEGEIPDIIYGVAIKEAREALGRELQDQGLTLEQYLARENMNQEQLNNALMMQVRTQLTRQFALNAYAKHKGLVVNEDDLNAFFESIAPGKANYAHADFKRDGRMYAARCAAKRLKAGRRAVQEAEVKRI
jgi:trigger factor